MASLARRAISATAFFAIVCTALSACSDENNTLLGRVQADVARHQVVVTHCHTMQLAKVRSTDDGDMWTPCKDAVVVIKDNMLFVNGEAYGQLAEGDAVLVENGRATIEPP